MEEIFLILYLLGAVCLVWYFIIKNPKKKKSKKGDQDKTLEDIVLKQAEDLDEKSEILIELYEKLHEKKDWIPNPKNKNSKVADLTRSKSAESGNNE